MLANVLMIIYYVKLGKIHIIADIFNFEVQIGDIYVPYFTILKNIFVVFGYCG